MLAIPLGAILMTTGMLAEGGLFAVPEVDSFDFIYDIVPDMDENRVYYDDRNNMMVADGQAYPPERVPNPDRFTGIARVGAAAYEFLNPWSGAGIETIRQIENEGIPVWAFPLYLCKAALWIVLPLLTEKRKKHAEQ